MSAPNPFTVARATLASPLLSTQAAEGVDALLAGGVDIAGQHYRLHGWRAGTRFSFSPGAPLVSNLPILRGRLVEVGGGVEAQVEVGARVEAIGFCSAVFALVVLGGGNQVLLQLFGPEVAPGGRIAGALEVLPGPVLIAGILGAGLWRFRRRASSHVPVLVDALRAYLVADGAEAGSRKGAAAPIE